jgi:hypothetical protein
MGQIAQPPAWVGAILPIAEEPVDDADRHAGYNRLHAAVRRGYKAVLWVAAGVATLWVDVAD